MQSLLIKDTTRAQREEIVRRMEAELEGGERTGFSPYRKDGGIYYNQRWILIIGRKPSQDP